MKTENFDTVGLSQPANAECRPARGVVHQVYGLGMLLMPLLGIMLGGCGTDGAPAADAGSSTEAAAPDTVAPRGDGGGSQPDAAWNASVTNVGAGLVLSANGMELIRMACVRDSREMTVEVPSFRSIASEERLSFGLDDEPYGFVAQVTPPPPRGMFATRPIEEAFLTDLEGAQQISAIYGSQPIGPFRAPDADQLEVFVGGCREAMTS